MKARRKGTAVCQRKDRSVRAILRNDLYTPESGVYKNLFDRLMTMSLDDLSMLEIIIRNKEENPSAAARAASEPTDTQVRQFERESEEWARNNPGAVMRAEEAERERQLEAETCFYCGDPAMLETHGLDPRCERHHDV